MELQKIAETTSLEQEQITQKIEYILTKLQNKGIEGEVHIDKTTGLSVSSFKCELENVEFNNDGALNITLYHQHKKASVSTSSYEKNDIDEAITRGIAMLDYLSADEFCGLADKNLMAFDEVDLDLFHPMQLNAYKAKELAITAEHAALKNKNISNSNGAKLSSSYGITAYGNTHGVIQAYRSSLHSLLCKVVANKNDNKYQNYAYSCARDFNELISASEIGELAAKKTADEINSQKIKTMNVPVIFSADVASSLFSHLVSAISGSAIYHKSSFLLNKVGDNIFPKWLTITESPLIAKALGSCFFDDEGVKTANKNIITNGTLNTYLLNSYLAKKLSTKDKLYQSTANAGGIYNWIINDGKLSHSFDELIKTMNTGVLITSLMGQSINYATGDYSRGAKGFWVENGSIKHPINEFTVAGNLNDMFKQIIAISDDVNLNSKIKTGSILIENMSIAGR